MTKTLFSVTLLLICGAIVQTSVCDGLSVPNSFPPESGLFNGTLYATCRMRPSTKLPDHLPKIYGQVLFRQDSPLGVLHVLFNLHGLGSRSRAIHIHQYGDLSEGCASTGGHYNPQLTPHPGHPGDFGNFLPLQGRLQQEVEARATLFGGQSVLGRAVVVHEGEDDLGQGGDDGSLLHGNAGPRLGCCVIGVSPAQLWVKNQHRVFRRRG